MTDLFSIQSSGAPEAPLFCEVVFPGPPLGKGRPRFRVVWPSFAKALPALALVARNPKAGFEALKRLVFVQAYTPAETATYEEALAWHGKAAMRGRAPLDEPLALRVFAMMPIPASWSNKKKDAAVAGIVLPATVPDDDNIRKIVGDALNGVVWVDDRKIVRSLIVKEYAEKPGVIVQVYRICPRN